MSDDPIPVVVHLKPWGRFNPDDDFFKRVRMVTGPYIPISAAACAALDSHESGADIYELANGELVTFGDADLGQALQFIEKRSIPRLIKLGEEG